METVLAQGEAAVAALCEALQAGAPLGRSGANGRAVVEDLEDLLGSVARAYPDRFLDELERRPELCDRFAVLAAVGRLEGERASRLLLGALDSTSGSNRWLALSRLKERGEPGVEPLLGRLLEDRDGLVVFATVTALRRVGTVEHLDSLRRIAGGKHTPIGTREAALDSLEAIGVRLGLPAEGPRRLVGIELPSGAEVVTDTATRVVAGELVAQAPGGDVVAVCDGIVVGVDLPRGGDGGRLILRRTVADERDLG